MTLPGDEQSVSLFKHTLQFTFIYLIELLLYIIALPDDIVVKYLFSPAGGAIMFNRNV